MVLNSADEHIGQYETLLSERERLVRLCIRITGDAEAAQDIAQETLMTAWQRSDQLRDPNAYEAWLSGIARNICRRWFRSHHRMLNQTDRPFRNTSSEIEAEPTDNFDLELELERDELAALLDQALAMLPESARTILIERYIKESPQAEVAERLGISEGAVAMRLHRGKLAFRRVLTTEFRENLNAYGFVSATDDVWQETRIWCSMCGQHRARGRLDSEEGEMILRCPSCYPKRGRHIARGPLPNQFRGMTRYKSILSRLTKFTYYYFNDALRDGTATCVYCGGTAIPSTRIPEEEPRHLREVRGVHARCQSCNAATWVSLDGFIMGLPEVHQFIQDHPRVHTLPEYEVHEVDGRSTVVVTFASVRDHHQIAVASASDTFDILQIHSR